MMGCRLLPECGVHTLLRLRTGSFYAQGVKANGLFFTRKDAKPDGGAWAPNFWVH
jgi:type I restriction enzyme M protein